MPPRFYVPAARVEESTSELPQDEAVHLTRVLRLSVGDEIRVFNGRGDEWHARVQAVSKQRVVVQLDARVAPAPEPRVRLALAVAVLKSDKMDDVIRDAVMLGVSSITPLITSRTEISARTLDKSARIARWQRIAVASAKQCGRAVVPDVHAALTFSDLITTAPRAIMLVEPAAAADAKKLMDLHSAPASAEGLQGPPGSAAAENLTLIVGPEGGWTEGEVQQARDTGAMLLTLGAQTLRADAVPLVALTALRVRLEDF